MSNPHQVSSLLKLLDLFEINQSTQDCYTVRMTLKSQFTKIILNEGKHPLYTDTPQIPEKPLNEYVHNEIDKMFKIVLEQIYKDNVLKDIIIAYLKDNKIIETTSSSRIVVDDEILKQFVKRTCTHAKLSEEVINIRYTYIKTKFDTLNKTQNIQCLFEDLAIYNLFFRIYLKGGMASRWICAYLNTLSSHEQKKNNKSVFTPVFTESVLKENLGSLSDYDFNCVINPEFSYEMYNKFVNEIERIIQYAFEGFITNGNLFIKQDIIEYMKKLATLALSQTDDENNKNVDNPVDKTNMAVNLLPVDDSPITCGHRSIVDIKDIFKLSRLMIGFQFKHKDHRNICFKLDNRNPDQATIFQKQISGFKINILAELIDISFPSYNNTLEKFVCWEYAYKAIAVTWCSVYTNSNMFCEIGFPEEQTESYRNKMTCIFIYSLDAIIHDLHVTIQDSYNRDEKKKITKREERLIFFKKLICLYNLLVYNTQYQTIYNDDLTNHCIDTAQLMFPTEFISKDVAVYISPLTKDITFKSNPTNNSILSKSNPNTKILSYQNDIQNMTLYIVRNYLLQILISFKGLHLYPTPNRSERSIQNNKKNTFYSAYMNAYDYVIGLLYNKENDFFIYSYMTELLVYLNKIIANLFVNCISFLVSLNDNFIKDFVNYYFIKRIMDIFNAVIKYIIVIRSTKDIDIITRAKNELIMFDLIVNAYTKEIILVMESLNSRVTRKFVRVSILQCTKDISRALFDTYTTNKVYLLIRGGVAVHFNLLNKHEDDTATTYSYDNINTNDIDYMIQIPFDNDDQTLANFKTRLYQYLNTTISNSSLEPGMTMSLSHPRTDLTQVIINYPNYLGSPTYDFIIPLDGTGNGVNVLPVKCAELLPVISHHVVEILYRTDQFDFINKSEPIADPYYITLSEKERSENPQVVYMAYLNKHSLLIEYNKILLQDLHWYRKAKYLRRIAALNGMILNNDKRKIYEGEFPLPAPLSE
jgi:hypothetical protein